MLLACLSPFLSEVAFCEEQSNEMTRIYLEQRTGRDSVSWQRIDRELSFARRPEAEMSHRSMVDTKCNNDGFGSQYDPAISGTGPSTVVAAWTDRRHGFSSIYAQRFSTSGDPLGNDSKVSDNLTEKWTLNPDIASDSSGNFVIVWEDMRNGAHTDVFAQRFNATGEPVGGNFKVNYNVDDTWQDYAKVAMNAQGNFAIVWQDFQECGVYHCFHIYGQRYNSSGVPQGSNFRVNDVDLDALDPDVAMDSAGNFMVVWTEARESELYSTDIYGQAYNPSGQRVGDNFRINGDSLRLHQMSPAVCANNQGEFIVVWVEWDPEGEEPWSRVAARRYSSPGVPQGGGFRISLEDTISQKDWPQVVMDANGNFVVAWASFLGESADADVFGQRYNHLNQPQGSNFEVNDDQPVFLPALSMTMTNSGDFLLAWSDDRIDNQFEQFRDMDIYCQRYNASGQPQGGNVKLNSENPDHLQSEPSISVDNTGSFVLAWTDWRNENWSTNHSTDIFGLIYNKPYTLSQLPNYRVNKDEIAPWHTQNSPSVTGYGSKQILTAWADSREGGWDIYVARNFPFYAGSAEYKVNEDVSPGNWEPSIAADSLGGFVVVWTDARNGYPKFDIYAQRYNQWDEAQGGNFRVNEEPFWVHQELASVDMSAGGDFVVVWEDFRESGRSFRYVYGQRFNHLGQPQGSNFKVNDQGVTFPEDCYYADVAVDRAGNFVVAWQLYSDIYAQRYDNLGNRIGGNFLVNDQPSLRHAPPPNIGSLTPLETDTIDYLYASPRLGVDMDRSGNFVVVWSDSRNGDWDIYGQRYHFTGMAWGENYRVNTDVGVAQQSYPDVAIDDSSIYFAWIDNRTPEYDYDVYVKVEFWSPRYLPGDANGDDAVGGEDINYLMNYLYRDGPPPDPMNAGDANADCLVTAGDVVYLISYLYRAGPPPKPGCVE